MSPKDEQMISNNTGSPISTNTNTTGNIYSPPTSHHSNKFNSKSNMGTNRRYHHHHETSIKLTPIINRLLGSMITLITNDGRKFNGLLQSFVNQNEIVLEEKRENFTDSHIKENFIRFRISEVDNIFPQIPSHSSSQSFRSRSLHNQGKRGGKHQNDSSNNPSFPSSSPSLPSSSSSISFDNNFNSNRSIKTKGESIPSPTLNVDGSIKTPISNSSIFKIDSEIVSSSSNKSNKSIISTDRTEDNSNSTDIQSCVEKRTKELCSWYPEENHSHTHNHPDGLTSSNLHSEIKKEDNNVKNFQSQASSTLTSAPSFLPLENDPNFGREWNQFAENERLFGIKTSFDENQYTIPIDRNSLDYQIKLKEAERIAHEISKSNLFRDDFHSREERIVNHIKDDSGIKDEDDQSDEESKYSSVRRFVIPPEESLNHPSLSTSTHGNSNSNFNSNNIFNSSSSSGIGSNNRKNSTILSRKKSITTITADEETVKEALINVEKATNTVKKAHFELEKRALAEELYHFSQNIDNKMKKSLVSSNSNSASISSLSTSPSLSMDDVGSIDNKSKSGVNSSSNTISPFSSLLPIANNSSLVGNDVNKLTISNENGNNNNNVKDGNIDNLIDGKVDANKNNIKLTETAMKKEMEMEKDSQNTHKQSSLPRKLNPGANEFVPVTVNNPHSSPQSVNSDNPYDLYYLSAPMIGSDSSSFPYDPYMMALFYQQQQFYNQNYQNSQFNSGINNSNYSPLTMSPNPTNIGNNQGRIVGVREIKELPQSQGLYFPSFPVNNGNIDIVGGSGDNGKESINSRIGNDNPRNNNNKSK